MTEEHVRTFSVSSEATIGTIEEVVERCRKDLVKTLNMLDVALKGQVEVRLLESLNLWTWGKFLVVVETEVVLAEKAFLALELAHTQAAIESLHNQVRDRFGLDYLKTADKYVQLNDLTETAATLQGKIDRLGK